jgi:hypothetical protein
VSTHYVDNKQLFKVIVDYHERVKQSKADNKPKPEIPRYVGECILMIANRLSTKPNFVNYSFRDEMIGDGIENCVSYFDNFDPEKSDNPFAYFTQIIYFAFIRRIQKEKKQQYIRHKTAENSMIFSTLFEQGAMEDEDVIAYTSELMYDNASEFIKSFEKGLADKRKERKRGLEVFIDEGTDEDLPAG